MAIVSKFSHASATVDLNDTETGFSMAGDGWMPAVATPIYKGDPEPVVETIHMRLKDNSQDAIATDMQALHFMQVQADAYINDPTVDNPVWLHAKMDNETGERRAVVYRIEVQYGASWYGDEATSLDIPVTLSVTRGPYWESTTARDLPTDTGATGMVYVYDYTASGASVDAHDIVGDVGARLRYFEIDPLTGYRGIFWMGTRTAAKHGTLANFVPTWELEDGTNDTDATDTVDATASDGNKVVVAESGLDWDNTWHRALRIELGDVTANEADNLGMFLWLLRAKVTSGTWEVQIRFGNSQSITMATGNTVELTNSSWGIGEMGISTIPNSNVKSILSGDMAMTRADGYTIALYAQRTAGSGNLELDCLAAVPVDTSFIKIEHDDPESENPVVFGQSPTAIWDGFLSESSIEVVQARISDDHFSLPVGDGRIYFVSSTDLTTHAASATTSLNPSDAGKYYERWLSLRGTE